MIAGASICRLAQWRLCSADAARLPITFYRVPVDLIECEA
jgi:hypothetical protein